MRASGAIFLTLVLWASTARGETVEEYVERVHGDVSGAVERGGPTQLGRAMDRALDTETIASDALAGCRDEWTPSQLAEFKTLLSALLRRSYTRGLKGMRGWSVTWRVSGRSGDRVRVEGLAVRAGEEPVPLGYSLRSAGDTWKIVDVEVEGTSLVRGYAASFKKVTAKEGPEGLLRRMRARVSSQSSTF